MYLYRKLRGVCNDCTLMRTHTVQFQFLYINLLKIKEICNILFLYATSAATVTVRRAKYNIKSSIILKTMCTYTYR